MKIFTSILFIILTQLLFSQEKGSVKIKYLQVEGNTTTPFTIENNKKNLEFLLHEKIIIKNRTDKWLFFTSTPKWVVENYKNGNITQFNFDSYPAVALNDSSKSLHHVNEVHAGSNGLSTSYKGTNVIVGVVDVGLDVTHPDFKTVDGKTRVLRYWDQTYSGVNDYTYYGYGQLWDSTAINNGLFNGNDPVANNGHGTSVTGRAAGNGLSVNDNSGFAPEADIVFVQSNLNSNNWTLTIADACDYIFKYADSVGKSAVINISLGTYLGSHDGNDPASELMEQLLDEHSGRIIVSAAGNSGNFGRMHVHGQATNDTTFVWWQNNPSANFFGLSNKIYMDIWADTTDARLIDFAFGADKPAPEYGFRGQTEFYNMKSIAGTVYYDTIYNQNHQRIATIEIYPELIDSAYHLEVYFSNVDSTSYYFRFMTKGTGEYDAWGSTNAAIKTNNMISTLPTTSEVPEIINYQMPDFNQSIVSSFNCSNKVISVGNVKSRNQHTNKNNSVYTTSNTSAIGELVTGSSKGPNRHNITKPDVAASGEFGISPIPSWKYTNSTYNNSVDINGYQGRNNGTSMASPTVTGIAALYLEKCNSASYQNFKTDLYATSIVDQFTGPVPNNSYGYGKPNALELLLANNLANIIGNSGICGSPINLSTSINSSIDSIIWKSTINNTLYTTSIQDTVSAIIYYGSGCSVKTDTVIVTNNSLPLIQGNTGICDSSIVLSLSPSTATDSIVWNNEINNDSITINTGGNYNAIIYYSSGCSMNTPDENVVLNQINQPSGNTGICYDSIIIVASTATAIDSIIWNSVINNDSITIYTPGEYYTSYYFASGCTINDTIQVIQNSILPNPVITENSGFGELICDNQPNYQWYLNGNMLVNETNSTLQIIPDLGGNYSVETISSDGCSSISNILLIENGIKELNEIGVYLYPNPTNSEFIIVSNNEILSISLTDSKGKEINIQKNNNHHYSIEHLSLGFYNIKIETSGGMSNSKIIKM